MKKDFFLKVLQEISQFLPQEEKRKVLNDIKKLSKEVQRLTVSNYRRRNLSVADTNHCQTVRKVRPTYIYDSENSQTFVYDRTSLTNHLPPLSVRFPFLQDRTL